MSLSVGKVRFLTKTLVFFLFSSFLIFLFYYSTPKINIPYLNTRLSLDEEPLPKNGGLYHLDIDTQVELTEEEWIEDIQTRMPDSPVAFWWKYRKTASGSNASCARLPNLLDLNFNNEYWQTLRTSNGTFQLLNAYMDTRTKKNRVVRILSMLDRIQPNVSTFCQFWQDRPKPKAFISPVTEYKYMWVKNWGNYRQGLLQPYLVSCEVPVGVEPAVVALVENPCEQAKNLLRVIENRPAGARKDFAVCVKGLDFPHSDLSVRLAEWIELLYILGAEKIYMYELEVHPNVSKILQHYQAEGKVHLTKLKLPGDQPNGPSLQQYFLKKKLVTKRQNELIPYNDCFYKHMYEYNFITLLDTDEAIVPVEGTSWHQLMEKVLPKAEKKFGRNRVASYNVRNVYFLDDLSHDHGWFEGIPTYMHMLQHVFRTKEFTKPGAYVKSFFDTNKTVVLHNHYPLACLGGCYSYGIETSDAQMQHYRTDCVSELTKSCKELKKDSVLDRTMWKFKEALVTRVNRTLRQLGFLVE